MVNKYTALTGLSELGNHLNVIKTIKVNNSSLTPDSDKAVNIDLTGYALKGDTLKYINERPYTPVNLNKPVGGKIFYVDDTSTAEYRFFDTEGNVITDAIGAGSTPAYYLRTSKGNGKDKYYVYNDQALGYVGPVEDPSIPWYEGSFIPRLWTYAENGEPVYNSLGTSDGIGTGRANTELVMAADNGKYITNNIDDNFEASHYEGKNCETVWYAIQQMRDEKIGDCDDWFLPSRSELEELRKAIGFVQLTTSDDPVVVPVGAVTGGVIAGTADGEVHYTDFENRVGEDRRVCYPSENKFWDPKYFFWSSSELSDSTALGWVGMFQAWIDDKYPIPKDMVYGLSGVIGVRAF